MEPNESPTGKAVPGAAAKALTESAKPKPKIPRWAWLIFSVAMIGIGVSQIYSGLHESWTLPACDSQRAKDSLSKVFKEHKFEPLRYDSIKTVSTSSDQVLCNAVLPLPDGVNLIADYSFFWEDKTAKIKYSLVRRSP